jgi:hypothetical protein
MYSSENRQFGNFNEELAMSLDREQENVHQLAQALSRNAQRQWQKAIEGVVAMPAAIATTIAASTLRTVELVTRTFTALQRSAEQTRQIAESTYNRERMQQRGGAPQLDESRERMSRPTGQDNGMTEPQHP